MKAKPLRRRCIGYEQCEPENATHIQLGIPGPFHNRILPVITGETRIGIWTWNGSVDKPTLSPNIMTKGNHGCGEIICHSIVTDGSVQFLADCTHEFVGQTLDLLEVVDG